MISDHPKIVLLVLSVSSVVLLSGAVLSGRAWSFMSAAVLVLIAWLAVLAKVRSSRV